MKNNWSEFPLVLTLPDVCEILNLSKPTVLRLLQEGTIKGTLIGKAWRIPKENLQKFLGVD